MNIFQYIKSLVPSLEKRQVLNDIRMVQEDISDITLPGYSSAVSLLGDRYLTSKYAVEFQKGFDQYVTNHRVKGSYLKVIHLALLSAVDQVQVIEDAANKHFAKDIISSGITYRQANILRYTEMLRFVTKYARLCLTLSVAGEINMVRGNSAQKGKEISAPESAWLERNKLAFMSAVTVIFESTRDLASVLNNVPDITADVDGAGVVANTVGISKLDPKRMGRVGFNGNPFYHLRMMKEDVMAAEYEAALEERRMLELLLLDMEKAQHQEEDAALQNKIEATRSRVENLKFRIEKRQREAEEA